MQHISGSLYRVQILPIICNTIAAYQKWRRCLALSTRSSTPTEWVL